LQLWDEWRNLKWEFLTGLLLFGGGGLTGSLEGTGKNGSSAISRSRGHMKKLGLIKKVAIERQTFIISMNHQAFLVASRACLGS
jgi:hypothetical protein